MYVEYEAGVAYICDNLNICSLDFKTKLSLKRFWICCDCTVFDIVSKLKQLSVSVFSTMAY